MLTLTKEVMQPERVRDTIARCTRACGSSVIADLIINGILLTLAVFMMAFAAR